MINVFSPFLVVVVVSSEILVRRKFSGFFLYVLTRFDVTIASNESLKYILAGVIDVCSDLLDSLLNYVNVQLIHFVGDDLIACDCHA